MKNKTEIVTHCHNCGALMVEYEAPAEHFADAEMYRFTPFAGANDKYDQVTGLKNYIKAFYCPNRKQGFLANLFGIGQDHEHYAKGKPYTKTTLYEVTIKQNK